MEFFYGLWFIGWVLHLMGAIIKFIIRIGLHWMALGLFIDYNFLRDGAHVIYPVPHYIVMVVAIGLTVIGYASRIITQIKGEPTNALAFSAEKLSEIRKAQKAKKLAEEQEREAREKFLKNEREQQLNRQYEVAKNRMVEAEKSA